MCDEKNQPRILIIEDDEHINNIIYDVLRKENFFMHTSVFWRRRKNERYTSCV